MKLDSFEAVDSVLKPANRFPLTPDGLLVDLSSVSNQLSDDAAPSKHAGDQQGISPRLVLQTELIIFLRLLWDIRAF